MANKIIRIGQEYEKAFKSICVLFKKGFVSSSVIKSVSDDDTIIYSEENNCEYVYSPDFKTIESDTKIEINSSGASWFKSIREKTDVDFGSSSWLSLIEKVSTDFHKANSFLEFEQKESVITGQDEALHKRVLKNFMSKFYPSISYTVKKSTGDDAIDDIYGISLLIELNSGTGESQKVLCKVFFRKDGYKFNILPKEESLEVIEQINTVIDSKTSGNDNIERTVGSEIIESVLGELEKVIESETFTESVILNSERDEKIVDHFLEKGPQGFVEINCRNVKVFGIYHVKWNNFPYEIYSNGEQLLRIIFDLKGRLTVKCMHCQSNSNLIVSKNVTTYRTKDGSKPVKMRIDKDDFGFDQDKTNILLKFGEIGRHLITKSHDNISRVKDGCNRIVCKDNLIKVEGETLCKDCPYPEVAYRLNDGSIVPTSTLAFARDKLALIKKEEVKKCKCCGRTFSVDYLKRNRCKLCNNIDSVTKGSTDDCFNKYKEYFPVFKRLFNGSKCVAIEDEDMVIISIDEKKYIISKLDINEEGFVENPKEVE